MDLSLILAIFAIILAGLSPFLTQWVNNRHELKMYNLTFYEAHRADVIESYLKSASAAIISVDDSVRLAYRAAYAEIFFYVDSMTWSDIRNLDTLLSGGHSDPKSYDFRQNELNNIIGRLSWSNEPRQYKTYKRHKKGNK